MAARADITSASSHSNSRSHRAQLSAALGTGPDSTHRAIPLEWLNTAFTRAGREKGPPQDRLPSGKQLCSPVSFLTHQSVTVLVLSSPSGAMAPRTGSTICSEVLLKNSSGREWQAHAAWLRVPLLSASPIPLPHKAVMKPPIPISFKLNAFLSCYVCSKAL